MSQAGATSDHEPDGQGSCVALVIEELSVGGAERMLVSMANQLQQRGWQVHVVCLRAAGTLARELDEGIPVHVLNKRPGVDITLPWRLSRCLRRIQPIVVNSHLWVGNTWTRLALLFSDVPAVVTEHSRDEWKSPLYRCIDRLLAFRTAAMITVSADSADYYRKRVGVKASLITVINNGINTRQFANGDGSRLRKVWLGQSGSASAEDRMPILIGTVGRMVLAKNHRRLIDAVALLQEDPELADQDIRLVMVGDGEDRQTIESHARHQGLAERVIFTGARRDIPDVLAAFDVFVLSSDREGHPLTALEAQAAGTPVVLTDAGGSVEAIARQGERSGGVLVQRSTEALTAALREMVLNPTLRAEQAQFGREYALRHFDQQNMIDRYVEIFCAVSSARTR